jgi:hypothetical protein
MPVTPNSDPLGILSQTTDNKDPLGILVPQKKNGGGNLSVDSKGQLQKSVPSVSVPQSTSKNAFENIPEFHAQPVDGNKNTIENNFNLPTSNQVAQGQKTVSDNTGIANVPEINTENLGYQKQLDKKLAKQNEDFKNKAIDNTVKKSLKLKGINAQPGSLLYNIEKSTYSKQLDNGNASVGVDNNGQPGLAKTTDWIESAKNGWNNAIQGDKDADSFVNNMTPAQQVDYLNKKQKEQNEYIGTRPTQIGSVTGKLAENAPFIGKAAIGYGIGAATQALAPETFGLSELGLPAATSFIATSGQMQNQQAFQGITSRYQILKHQHPEWSDEQAMTEANKDKDIDKAQGLITNYLFNQTLGGNKPITGEVRNTLVNNVKGIIKSSAEGAGKITGVQALRDISDNAKGLGSGHQLNDLANEFVDNFGTIGLLHAVTSGVSALPNLLKSSIKNLLLA